MKEINKIYFKDWCRFIKEIYPEVKDEDFEPFLFKEWIDNEVITTWSDGTQSVELYESAIIDTDVFRALVRDIKINRILGTD